MPAYTSDGERVVLLPVNDSDRIRFIPQHGWAAVLEDRDIPSLEALAADLANYLVEVCDLEYTSYLVRSLQSAHDRRAMAEGYRTVSPRWVTGYGTGTTGNYYRNDNGDVFFQVNEDIHISDILQDESPCNVLDGADFEPSDVLAEMQELVEYSDGLPTEVE